jgi:hypothetical protein
MKYVKCINPLGVNLTYQKVYEVILYWTSDWSKLTYHVIVNDEGLEATYDDLWFEDASAEVRQNKLEQLGI